MMKLKIVLVAEDARAARKCLANIIGTLDFYEDKRPLPPSFSTSHVEYSAECVVEEQ